MKALKIAAVTTALVLPGALSAQQLNVSDCTASGGTPNLATGTCELNAVISTSGPFLTTGQAAALGSSPATIAIGITLGFIAFSVAEGS
ncbi:MAG: hypothetical protein AAF647_00165 [Pseudomonadota bacterium]